MFGNVCVGVSVGEEMKILKLLMLSISFISASENTLLNFKWGMSIDEVKEVAKGKFEIISEVEKKNYGEILNSGFSKVFSLPKSEIESAFTVLGIENTANGMEEYWRTCLCDKFIDIHNITALGYPMSVSHASVLTLKNREGKVFLYFSNGNLEVINKVIGKKSDGHLEKELKRKYGKGTGVREGCKFIYGNELMLTNSKHYQMNGSGISLNTTNRDK